MERLHQYVITQLGRGETILKNKLHSALGARTIPRNYFVRLKKYIEDFEKGINEPRLLGLTGLRGVGKTTLLAHLYCEVLQDKKYKLFLSGDELIHIVNHGLQETLEAYQDIIGIRFEETTENIYLLIDEVHFDPKWTHTLKVLYDTAPRVFVICTGSSALSINMTTDLSRRFKIETIHPLCFTEYRALRSKVMGRKVILPPKGLKKTLKEALFFSENSAEAYKRLLPLVVPTETYWQDVPLSEQVHFFKTGTLPFALTISDEETIREMTLELIRRIIDQDLPEIGNFTPETMSKVMNILSLIADSDILSLNSVSNNLDIDRITLEKVIDALIASELITKVPPLGGVTSKIVKPSKYYFATPLIQYALLHTFLGQSTYEKSKGKLLETLLANIFFRLCKHDMTLMQYDNSKNGADFILSFPERKVAIEVGHGSKGPEQVIHTLDRIGAGYGIIFAKTTLRHSSKDNLVFVPSRWALLL